MNIDVEMKSEPTIKTEQEEIIKETETVIKMDDETLADDNDEDDDDPVEKEIDVYISKSLANNIYVLQVCLF